jgi:RNA-directed DNA polymerase
LAKRLWVLDADLAAAFDRIDHDRLIDAIGSFPGRGNPGLAEGGNVRER